MSDPMRSSLLELVNSPSFLQKYRGYAAILAQLQPVADRNVEVMAVSFHRGRFFLHINVHFFLGDRLKNMKYFAGVLLHEVHHIILEHVTDPRFQLDTVPYPELLEVAMEISANEYIQEELPGKPARWQDFRQFGVGSGQSTLERYRLLEKAQQDGRSVPIPALVDTHLDLGPGQGGTHAAVQQVRERWVELLHRAAAELERAGEKGAPQARVAGKPLADFLGGLGGLPPGTQPGSLLEMLDDPTAQPQHPIAWKAALRLFACTLRSPGLTYQRPNRRFPGLVGWIPGRSRFALRDKPALIAAIDTSGSMTRASLNEIARQLRLLDPLAAITVVECDAAITRVYPFPGVLDSVTGRGGTDFRPVFAPDFLRGHRPDGVVWFTDGCGPFPEEPPALPTLWVLTLRSPPFLCPWGKKVYLEASDFFP